MKCQYQEEVTCPRELGNNVADSDSYGSQQSNKRCRRYHDVNNPSQDTKAAGRNAAMAANSAATVVDDATRTNQGEGRITARPPRIVQPNRKYVGPEGSSGTLGKTWAQEKASKLDQAHGTGGFYVAFSPPSQVLSEETCYCL